MASPRKRRFLFVALVVFFVALFSLLSQLLNTERSLTEGEAPVSSGARAIDKLEDIEIKGRAAKSGYVRQNFTDGWGKIDGCDVRNLVLQRDLKPNQIKDGCVVSSGRLNDPYTGKTINFQRGPDTSPLIQIDHVVALSDAWQKGAQYWEFSKREKFANDPLNLLAVDGDINQKKGNGDAATWLPPNKAFRCQYVARQIAVKLKYGVWITPAEHAAMKRILQKCPDQTLPVANPKASR